MHNMMCEFAHTVRTCRNN